MQLYNTLSRSKSPFEPISSDDVKLYTCGPTVYSYYHIGNLRNAVFNDTLRRSLIAAGYSVKHVMNITDVGHLSSDADEGEDKLEKGAQAEGKSVWEVAQAYTDAFKHDMAAMNILPPNGYHSPKYQDNYARATEFIDQQVEMVKTLIDKGFAYQTKQAIYFDVTNLANYGELTGQKLADKEVGARDDVVSDPDKHNPHDFAVWFFTVGHFAEHSMKWPSPWGEGFPGWHLECSAIIHATLGDPIDIHTGGVDHIGTHHPNEMAQTEAAFGHKLANYWVHNEFILVDGAKMAKSKSNSYTLREVTDRGFSPLALRLLYLQAHYRTEINFTWESLEAAQNRLISLNAWADLQFQAVPGKSNPDFSKRLRGTLGLMKTALEDDLNTPKALAHLSELVDWMQAAPLPERDLEEFKAALDQLDQLLGLDFTKRKDISETAKRLITEREANRKAQNFIKADELRRTLSDQGLEVDDTPHGTRWKRVAV